MYIYIYTHTYICLNTHVHTHILIIYMCTYKNILYTIMYTCIHIRNAHIMFYVHIHISQISISAIPLLRFSEKEGTFHLHAIACLSWRWVRGEGATISTIVAFSSSDPQRVWGHMGNGLVTFPINAQWQWPCLWTSSGYHLEIDRWW